jgi:hypothetical protein
MAVLPETSMANDLPRRRGPIVAPPMPEHLARVVAQSASSAGKNH